MLFGLNEEKKIISKMESMIIDSFSQFCGSYDELSELAIILGLLYKDCDFSFYSREEERIVWSSIVNEERLQEASSVFKMHLRNNEKMNTGIPLAFSKEELQLRKGVYSMQVIPMEIGGGCLAYLCIEIFSDIKLPSAFDMGKVFPLISAAYFICVRKSRERYLIGLDKGTMLPSREQLTEDLKTCVNSDTPYSVGLLQIINVKAIKAEYGLQEAESRLKSVASIAPQIWKKVYYIGNGALVFMFDKELYPAYAKMEEILDALSGKIEDMQYGGVVTPLRDNIYETLYILELKSAQLRPDTVSIVRERESSDAPTEDVLETVTVENGVYTDASHYSVDIEEVDATEIYEPAEIQIVSNQDTASGEKEDCDTETPENLENSGKDESADFFCDFNKFFDGE